MLFLNASAIMKHFNPFWSKFLRLAKTSQACDRKQAIPLHIQPSLLRKFQGFKMYQIRQEVKDLLTYHLTLSLTWVRSCDELILIVRGFCKSTARLQIKTKNVHKNYCRNSFSPNLLILPQKVDPWEYPNEPLGSDQEC